MAETITKSTAYNPSEVEDRWYRFWEEGGFFSTRTESGKEPFVIPMPPPKILGRKLAYIIPDKVVGSSHLERGV